MSQIKNKYESYLPLMFENEYKFVEKYIDKSDTLLEWGSGNGTIYFSGLVKKLISIEHDLDWYNTINKTISILNCDNIELVYVKPTVMDQSINRYEQLKDYVDYPIVNQLKFDKVLIDGRARKYCAMMLYEYINDDTIVLIHDFNFNDVEGYVDDYYFSDILTYYDIIELDNENRGIVALKKKTIGLVPNKIDSRDDLQLIIPPHSVCIELGVFNGDFSDVIYEKLNPIELHLVDIFEGYTHSGDKDGGNIVYSDLNDSYNKLLKKYSSHNVLIHKGLSKNILSTFPDNYFDFIYIDASHDYVSVKEDLELSYLKVKKGGIIGGHDYDCKKHSDVVMAVNEFCYNFGLRIDTLTKDKLPSYFIKK